MPIYYVYNTESNKCVDAGYYKLGEEELVSLTYPNHRIVLMDTSTTPQTIRPVAANILHFLNCYNTYIQ